MNSEWYGFSEMKWVYRVTTQLIEAVIHQFNCDILFFVAGVVDLEGAAALVVVEGEEVAEGLVEAVAARAVSNVGRRGICQESVLMVEVEVVAVELVINVGKRGTCLGSVRVVVEVVVVVVVVTGLVSNVVRRDICLVSVPQAVEGVEVEAVVHVSNVGKMAICLGIALVVVVEEVEALEVKVASERVMVVGDSAPAVEEQALAVEVEDQVLALVEVDLDQVVGEVGLDQVVEEVERAVSSVGRRGICQENAHKVEEEVVVVERDVLSVGRRGICQGNVHKVAEVVVAEVEVGVTSVARMATWPEIVQLLEAEGQEVIQVSTCNKCIYIHFCMK